MNFGQIKHYLIIGVAVFFLLMVIGLISNVTLGVSIYRAFLGGVLFSIISFSLNKILRLFVFPEEEQPEEEIPSSRYDFRIDDDGIAQTGVTDNGPEKPSGERPTDNTGFEALQAKQINPGLSRIINDNPGRAAELIRKMGLEE